MLCQECHRETRALSRGMCSACYRRWRRENASPNAQCEQCGRSYFNGSPRRHSLCSRECFQAWKKARDWHNEPTNGGTIVMCVCQWCIRPFGVAFRLVARGGGRYCSLPCWGVARRLDPSKATSPENAWRQRAGYTPVRNAILHASGVRCARCGEERTHNNIVVHHIVDPGRDRQLLLDPKNLELLCRRCHMQEHHARGDLLRG
jgi:hypothetical protein